jgi:hypothetical protein
MSNHKTPVTELERAGLVAHGLGRQIGKPSQLADVFRQGVAWALSQQPAQLVPLTDELAAERERFCAAIKAADDEASDNDYMLDSNNCISVIRGTWNPQWIANNIKEKP